MMRIKMMEKTAQCFLVCALTLGTSILVNQASAQQAQVVPAVNDLKNGVDTVRPAPQPNQRGFIPGVDINRENNQSKVDVHVPIFFDMTNVNNPDKSKLDLSVLNGLVTVQKDKERDQDGQMNGPMKVTVFGIPVYINKGNPPRADSSIEPIKRIRKQVEDTINHSREDVSYGADDLSHKVADHFQTANNKLMNSLGGFFERMANMLKQNPFKSDNSANVNKGDTSGNQKEQTQSNQQMVNSTLNTSSGPMEKQTQLGKTNQEQPTNRVAALPPASVSSNVDSRLEKETFPYK